MPFKSEKQRRYLHQHHPEVARRFEQEEASGDYEPKSKRKRGSMKNLVNQALLERRMRNM